METSFFFQFYRMNPSIVNKDVVPRQNMLIFLGKLCKTNKGEKDTEDNVNIISGGVCQNANCAVKN